jgi:phenylalanyl-tRNA synthetase alpha chain
MSCFSCKDNTNNCYICKDTRWIEILGAGIVHRNILEKFNIKKNVTGFAFGIGVERLLMIKFGVKDIREFYINNIKILKQFQLI